MAVSRMTHAPESTTHECSGPSLVSPEELKQISWTAPGFRGTCERTRDVPRVDCRPNPNRTPTEGGAG